MLTLTVRHLYQLGNFDGKAPDLLESRRTRASVRSGPRSQKPKQE